MTAPQLQPQLQLPKLEGCGSGRGRRPAAWGCAARTGIYASPRGRSHPWLLAPPCDRTTSSVIGMVVALFRVVDGNADADASSNAAAIDGNSSRAPATGQCDRDRGMHQTKVLFWLRNLNPRHDPNACRDVVAPGVGPSGTWMCHDPSTDRTSARGMGQPPGRRRPLPEPAPPLQRLAASTPQRSMLRGMKA